MKNQIKLFVLGFAMTSMIFSCKKKDEVINIAKDVEVNFSAASASVEEGKTTSVKVTLPAKAPKDVTFELNVGGTAKYDTDYTSTPAVASKKMKVAIKKDATEATVSIATKDNQAKDGDKTVELSLVAISGFKVRKTAKTVITITDNDSTTPKPEVKYAKISDLRAKEVKGQTVDISEDTKIKAVVISERTNFNVKNMLVQGATGGITIRFKVENKTFELGDELEIDLKGGKLGRYRKGALQIDSVDLAKTKKLGKGTLPTPVEISVDDLLAGKKEGTLVKVSGVSIKGANGTAKFSSARKFTNCTKEFGTYIQKTAKFKDEVIPKGKGTAIGVADNFGGRVQLHIRSTSDLSFSGKGCDEGNGGGISDLKPVVTEKFDGKDLGTFKQVSVTGSQTWKATDGKYGKTGGCIQMNSYDRNAKANVANEDWLISPKISLKGKTKANLEFFTNGAFGGSDLEFYVSTDYTGSGKPGAATWKKLTATFDTKFGSRENDFVSSGKIDLKDYLKDGVYFAFKYTSQDGKNKGRRWSVDDFTVSAK